MDSVAAKFLSALALMCGFLCMGQGRAHAQNQCVFGQGKTCKTSSDCRSYPDAPMCVDGACQIPCDDGTGLAVPNECSLGETCVAGTAPGLGKRNYCKPAPFRMDLNLLDSCIYYFVEGTQPDLGSNDKCSLARNLNALLDRDGTDGFTIYDVDLCIRSFLEEQPCDTATGKCADGQAFCTSDAQCGDGLFCDQDVHHCARECGLITSRSQSLIDALDRQCAGSMKVCDYTRGRCDEVALGDASCSIDQDCPHGAYCFLGQCEPECYRSLDCPDGTWYCGADNTCQPKPSAGASGAAFDLRTYSIQFAQRSVSLDPVNDTYDIPVLIMSTVTKKQVFDSPNVVFGYRLEASYSRKQEGKCLGDLTQLSADDQKDCIISADEEFVTLENPFGTLYGAGDPVVRLRLNQGIAAKLSPGVYEATVTAIFNNGTTSSATVHFEKTSPSGEYLGQLSVYLDGPDNLLATTNLSARFNVGTDAPKVAWNDLLNQNNLDQNQDMTDVTRGFPVTGYLHGFESALFANPAATTPAANEIPVKGIYADDQGRMHLIAVMDIAPDFCSGESGACTIKDATDLEIKNVFGRKLRRIIEFIGPYDAKTRYFSGMYRETISGLAPGRDVTLDGGFTLRQSAQDRSDIKLPPLLDATAHAAVGFPAIATLLSAIDSDISANCSPTDAAKFASKAAFQQYLASYDSAGPVLANLVKFESRLRTALNTLSSTTSAGYLTLTDYFKGQIVYCDATHTSNCVKTSDVTCGLSLYRKAILSGWLALDDALGEAKTASAPLFCADRAGNGDCSNTAATAPTLVALQEHNRFYREFAQTQSFRAGEALSDAFHTLYKAAHGDKLDGSSAFAHKQSNLREALDNYDAIRADFFSARAAHVLFAWPMDAFQTVGKVWLDQVQGTLKDRMDGLTQLFDLRRRLTKNTTDQDALFLDQVLQQEYLQQVYLAALQHQWEGERFAWGGEASELLTNGQILLGKMSASRNPLGLHPNRIFFENSSKDTTLSNWEYFRNRVAQQVDGTRKDVTSALDSMQKALADSNSLLSRLQVEQNQLDASLTDLCGDPSPLPTQCDATLDQKQLATSCQGKDCLVEYSCDSDQCDQVSQAFKTAAGQVSNVACRTDTPSFKVKIGSDERLCVRGRVGALFQERVGVDLKRKQAVDKVKALLRQIARQQELIAQTEQSNKELIDYLHQQDDALVGIDTTIAAADLLYEQTSEAANGAVCLTIVGVANGTDCVQKAVATALKVVAIVAKQAVVPGLEILKAQMARAKEIKLEQDKESAELRTMRMTLDNLLTEVENSIDDYTNVTQQLFNIDTQIDDVHAAAQRTADRYQDTIKDVVSNLVGNDSAATLLRNGLVQRANTDFDKLLVETYKMTQAFVHHFNASTDGVALTNQVFQLMTVDEVDSFAKGLDEQAASYCAREGIDCDAGNNRDVLEFSMQHELFPDLRDIVDPSTGKVLTVGQQFHNLITSSAFVRRRQLAFGASTQIEIPFAIWANNRGADSGAAEPYLLNPAECNHIIVGDRDGHAGTIAANVVGTRLGQTRIDFQLQRGATDYMRSCTEKVKPDESLVNTYLVGWSPSSGIGQLDQPPAFFTQMEPLPACVNNVLLGNPATQPQAASCFQYFARDRSLAAPDWVFILPQVDAAQKWLLGNGQAEDEKPIIEDIVLYFRHNARVITSN